MLLLVESMPLIVVKCDEFRFWWKMFDLCGIWGRIWMLKGALWRWDLRWRNLVDIVSSDLLRVFDFVDYVWIGSLWCVEVVGGFKCLRWSSLGFGLSPMMCSPPPMVQRMPKGCCQIRASAFVRRCCLTGRAVYRCLLGLLICDWAVFCGLLEWWIRLPWKGGWSSRKTAFQIWWIADDFSSWSTR